MLSDEIRPPFTGRRSWNPSTARVYPRRVGARHQTRRARRGGGVQVFEHLI